MSGAPRRQESTGQNLVDLERRLALLERTTLRFSSTFGFHQRGKTDQNIGSGTPTLVNWQNADYTDDTAVDIEFVSGAGNQYFIIHRAGLYHIATSNRWASNSTGVRGLHVRLRASSGAANVVVVAGEVAARGTTGAAASFERRLIVGNELDVEAFQNSGGTLALTGGVATWITVRRIR